METSWKFINKELGMNCKNYGFQSVNINGRSIRNLQSIANAFNKHFTTFPTIISQKINASNCFTSTSDNNQNSICCSLNNVYRNSFPNIKYCCTTTKEIENIIRTLKTSNSCGYEVPSKLLKLCSFILAPPPP
jgi:hypothetical protein